MVGNVREMPLHERSKGGTRSQLWEFWKLAGGQHAPPLSSPAAVDDARRSNEEGDGKKYRQLKATLAHVGSVPSGR